MNTLVDIFWETTYKGRIKILSVKKLILKMVRCRYPLIDTMWLSSAIWRQKSGSILARVMAWCLTAPSHYLSQCWHIFNIRGFFVVFPWGQFHDDVIKWKHFPRYWPFVLGIHRSRVNSPHKGKWRGALMLSLICALTNDWINNRYAVDLRRHRAHNDVTVMFTGNVQYIHHWYEFKDHKLKITGAFPGTSELIFCRL